MTTKIDIDSLVNPGLSKHSLLEYQGTCVEVAHVDDKFIYIFNNSLLEQILDDEWQPIFLDEDWLHRLGLEENQKIKHIGNDLNWIIKRLGNYYYLTIFRDFENPVIPVHSVHELQYWYFWLTNNPLTLQNKRLGGVSA